VKNFYQGIYPMIYNFNLIKILISISSILAIDTLHTEELFRSINQKEKVNMVLKDIDDILLGIDSDDFFEFKKRNYPSNLHSLIISDSNKVNLFFNRPIVLSNLNVKVSL
jgi:hypothetical protein